MKIPTNYRRVKTSEQPRTGDYYIHRASGDVYNDYTFWRKRKKAIQSKAVNDKGLPLVGFTYTNKGQVTYRTVKVTKATVEYIEGFEQVGGGPFKRFLRMKAEGIHLLRFNS